MTKPRALLGILIGLSLLFVISCERVNSEFSIPGAKSDLDFLPGPGKPGGGKALCDFEVSSGCWVEVAQYVQACMASSKSSQVDQISADGSFCSNNAGKIIDFAGDMALDNKNYRGLWKFKAYSRGVLCFNFNGTAESFRLETPDFGTFYYHTRKNGDVALRCLDGSTQTIPVARLQSECTGNLKSIESNIPGVQISADTEDKAFIGWSFNIKGSQPTPVYSCKL